jgi:hypothetical protein
MEESMRAGAEGEGGSRVAIEIWSARRIRVEVERRLRSGR